MLIFKHYYLFYLEMQKVRWRLFFFYNFLRKEESPLILQTWKVPVSNASTLTILKKKSLRVVLAKDGLYSLLDIRPKNLSGRAFLL